MIPMYRYDYKAYMDYKNHAVRCPRKAIKFNHSFTHCEKIYQRKKYAVFK